MVDLNESSFQESCGDTTPANSSFTDDGKICSFTGLDGVLYKYEPSQDSSGYIPKVTRAVPIPKEFELPRRDELEMDPIELELMIFINKHFLSPSIYNDIMKWARKAYTSNYTFESPCYHTLKKRLAVSFPPVLHGRGSGPTTSL